MYGTFKDADVFNSELAWDTSSVTSMGYMFYNAEAFDQQLAWDISSADTAGMFVGSAGGSVVPN